MSVRYVRKELMLLNPVYKMIRAVIAGPTAVKAAGSVFLPIPNAQDTSDDNLKIYAAYKERAMFLEATGRTLEGYIGQIYYRDAIIKLPAELATLEESIDGGELTLVQQSKETCNEVLSLGRAGLLTDYPETKKTVTKAQQLTGEVRPNVILYRTEQIINWRWTLVKGKRRLSLLVLEEDYDLEDDGYETQKGKQWRVFKLLNLEGKSVVQSHIERETKAGFEVTSKYILKDGAGKPWDVIPFSFCGSKNNDPEPDKPPLEGMAHINIGHYRNSAAYEDSIYQVGQPTPWASALTEDWIKDVWKGPMRLGGNAVLALPPNGQCGMLQPEPNTMAKEGMESKEKQMAALGAKIIENIEVQRTATETSTDSVMENSTLSNVAKNVSAAYLQALQFAARYAKANEKQIEFELNTDFEISKLTAQERAQLLSEWQGGGITWIEYRWNVKRAGVAFEDDKVAKAQIETDQADSLNLEVEKAGKLADATNPTPEPEEE